MILPRSPRQAAAEGPGLPWVWLGRSGQARDAVAARLGTPPLPLGKLLHERASALRGPFLDVIASLGQGFAADHRSAAKWWASTISWKAWTSSDLFLLCAYQALCADLAAAPKPLGVERLRVVIEDPWLLSQLGVQGPSMRAWAWRAAAVGLLRRAKWLLRTAKSKLLQGALSRRLPATTGRTALLFSHLQERALEGASGFRDFYLTGLEEELKADGWAVARFHDSDVLGFEAELAARAESFFASLLFGSWSALLKAALDRPPKLCGEHALEGRPIGRLLEREWWHDFSRAGRCSHLFFLSCVEGLLEKTRPAAVVFPWENQPQDRMIVLAARRAGARAIGYQHTTVPRIQLPFFAGRGEAAWAPLPDALLVSGPQPLRRLIEGGLPSALMTVGGSRRFPLPKQAAAPASSQAILLALPVDRDQADHMLRRAKRAFPDGGAGLRVLVKAHPSEPMDEASLPPGWALIGGSTADALKACGPVIFSGSTVGLEALMAGHPVLRYRSETLLNIDSCDSLPDSELATAGDGDFPDKLEDLRPQPSGERARQAFLALFSPLDQDAWRAAIEGRAAHKAGK